MKKKKIFFLVGMLCLIVVIAVGYYHYQKPRSVAGNMKQDFQLSAQGLFSAYESNTNEADEKYTGKIITVKGIVQEKNTTSGTSSILLSASNEMGGINVNLHPSQSVDNINAGDKILVKGRCSGFLIDVNLTDAYILKSN